MPLQRVLSVSVPAALGSGILGLLLVMAVSGDPGSPTTDEAAVLEVVDRLFDGMRARDGSMVGSVFHSQARLASTGVQPDGAPRVQVQDIQGFVDAVGQGGDPWNEPLFDTEVRVDDNLAHVWTFYRFYAGDQFSHCGFNSIQLANTPEGWKILSIMDTRRTDECETDGRTPR